MEGRPRTPSITDTIVMINTVDSAMKVAHDILSTLEAASADLAASQQYVKKYILLKAEQLTRIANGTDFANKHGFEDDEDDDEEEVEDEDDDEGEGESEQIHEHENLNEWHDRRSSGTPQWRSPLVPRHRMQNNMPRVQFHKPHNTGSTHYDTTRPPTSTHRLQNSNFYLARGCGKRQQAKFNSTGSTSSKKPQKKTIISKFLRCSVSDDPRPQREKRRKVETGMLQVALPPLFLKDMPRFMQKPFPRPPACIYTPPHVIKPRAPATPLSNRNGGSIIYSPGVEMDPLPSTIYSNDKKRTWESDDEGITAAKVSAKKLCAAAEVVSASGPHGRKRIRDADDEEDASPRPRKGQRLSDSAPLNPCREVVLFTGPPSPSPSPPRRRLLPLPQMHHDHHLFVCTPSASASISPSQKTIEERRRYLKLRALGMLPLNPIPELKVGSRSGKRPQGSDKHAYFKCLLIREYLCNRQNLPGNLAIRSSPVSSLVRSSFTRDEVDMESEPDGGYRIGPDPFSISTRLKWQSPLSFGEEEDD